MLVSRCRFSGLRIFSNREKRFASLQKRELYRKGKVEVDYYLKNHLYEKCVTSGPLS